MNAPPELDAPSARLVLAAAFLEPLPERLAGLRRAVAAAPREPGGWEPVVAALEMHGVLPLARRNLILARAELPARAGELLARRDAALREDARRDGLTLRRFLEAAAREGVEATLLKGASLATDLYAADPALRSQGDVDLLVEPREVRRALGAAAAIGLLPTERQLPLWWYRLTHFHVKLTSPTRLLRDLEIHWRLHAPALLLTADPAALRRRRVPVDLAGARAWSLDAADRLLHLVTHLVSHWDGVPGRPDRELVVAALRTSPPPIRLKWVVDVAAEIERIASALPAALLPEGALAGRAREWSAEARLAWCLNLVRDLGLAPAAARWAEDAARRLPAAPTAPARPARKRPREQRPVEELGFRLGTLASLPRWIWPPAGYLERRYGGAALARGRHAAAVLARAALAAAALPVALAGRELARPRRRRARRSALAPERVLDLVAGWRGARVSGEPEPPPDPRSGPGRAAGPRPGG